MASLGNSYPNLPGMLVEFKDGGQALKFDQTEVNTDSMLILGTAVDGPVMEPVAVDESTAELLFGSELKANGAPNGSTLIRAFKEAAANGCQDIRLMRITGKEAEATIQAPSETVSIDKRIDENLGYIDGNSETEIELVGKGVIEDTVKVLAKGKLVDSKYITVDENLGTYTVTLAKGACDAGSMLSIEYQYEKEVPVTDTDLVLSAEKELFLSEIPVGKVTVKSPTGATIDEGEVQVDGRKVTLTESGAQVASAKAKGKGARDVGDKYTVEYNTKVSGVSIEDTDARGQGLVAKTEEQEMTMSLNPKSNNDLSLYIDDTLVLDKSTYRVSATDKKIFLKKEYFQKASKVSVSYFATETKVVKREVKIKSIFGGDIYNEAKVEVLNINDANGVTVSKAVRLTKPSSKLSAGEQPMVFTADNFETFGELVEAINTYSGIFKAETNVPNELTSELSFTETYFRGGDNGVDATKEELFEALSGKRDASGFLEKQGAYQLLENYQVDWVTPVGVYADDQLLDRNKDFAYELALFCAVNSFRNKSVYGTIAMKPLQDTSLAAVQEHAKYLASFHNQYFMKDSNGSIITDGSGNGIDLGKFISVIAGPTITINHNVLSLREANGAVAYAAYNTVLLPQSAPTNKKLPGTTGIKYNFSNAQLNDIAGNRMVCFGKKFSARGQVIQGAYVVDGPTSARIGSEYGRISTLKVMREVSDQIRDVADPFIGEANTIEQRNALSAAISKRLDALVSNGVLLNYSFNLVATQRDQVLGQASLELGIIAPQELRKITTVMGLKQGA